jgi:WD40 repeat protein
MAWSPSPAHPYLVACGLSSGRTHLLNLSPATLSLPVTSSSFPVPTLHIKHSRAITSLTFSPLDASYLAGGLERHRSDPSLLIWDVHDAVSRMPLEQTSWIRPSERIEITNPLALTTRPGETRHIQQYCPSEQVNSVAFLPTSYSVLASTNNRQIRLFDLRAPSLSSGNASPREPAAASGGASSVWLTKAVYSLTPDPSVANRFASWESAQGGGTVRIWDARKTGEVLSFDVNEGIVELCWMKGGLGVGTREGGVGVWEIISGRPVDGDEWATMGEMRQSKSTSQSHTDESCQTEAEHAVLCLFVERQGR